MQNYPDANRGVGGNIKINGSTSRPSFIDAPGYYPYQINIYYDSRKTAVEKLLFTRFTGCQGVLIWDITSDDTSNSVIDELFKNSGKFRRWKLS